MKKKRANRNNKRGILLLEVLISIAIIGATLVVINRAFSVSLKAVKSARDYLLATCVLEDKAFDILAESRFDDVKTSDKININQQELFYVKEISLPKITSSKDEDLKETNLKEAKLGIGWADNQNISRLNVSTYVFGKRQKEKK